MMTDNRIHTISVSDPDRMIREADGVTAEFIFFDAGASKKLPEKLAAALKRDPEAVLVSPATCKKTHAVRLPEAVLTGAITPDLNNKLIRTSAFKQALAQVQSLGLSHLFGAALMTALPGRAILLPSKEKIRRNAAEPGRLALCPEYARFSAFANVLPHPQVAEEDHRMQVDSFTYRMIAEILQKTPDDECRKILPLMLKTLDARLVYFAVTWYKKHLLSELKVDRLPQTPRPVRKIGFFCSTLRNGGAERCTAILLEYFASRGMELTLFAREEKTDKDYAAPESLKRVVLSRLPHERRAQIAAELEKRDIDTCIFADHADWRTENDIISARNAGARTIVTEHSLYAYPWYMGLPELAIQRDCVYPAADVVTVLSRADQERWRLKGIDRAVYVPNPLTFDGAKDLTADRNTHTMIFVARLSEAKGASAALDVLALVRAKYPDAKLLMVGRGSSDEYDSFLRKKISDLQLEDAVTFTGYTTDVGQYYRQSSVFLMPSLLEGYPMTLMEAKAYALPCVMFAMPYLEAAGQGCIQVPQGDASPMADAVCDLFGDPDELKRIGDAAKRSLADFSNDAVHAVWDAIFRYLETGSDTDGLFAEKEPADARLQRLGIALEECRKAQAVCLNHPDFLDAVGERTRETYLKAHPVLHLLARLAQTMPKLANVSGKLCAKLTAGNLLKKLYRKRIPAEETGGRNGFPPYC